MKTLHKKLAVLLMSAFGVLLLAGGLAPAVVSAQADPFQAVCAIPGAKGNANNPGSVVCTATGNNNISGPGGIIIKVANIFAFVTGVGAVFVIMIGGFMYITANGDSSKASSGKNAVLFAVVGLVVVVIGRAIIGFVVTKVE